MRLILSIFLIGLLLSGSALGKTVLVIGDSISAAYGLNEADGWVQLAEEQLREQGLDEIDFVNASISGDTTEGGLRRLPAAIERFSPDVVVIELGGNDGLRGYSLKKLRSNLEQMVAMAQAGDAQALILGMRIPSNYGAAYTNRFAKAFTTAANNTGAALVPFLLEPIATDQSWFLPDGIHPNAEAQPLLAEHVLEVLSPMLVPVVSQ